MTLVLKPVEIFQKRHESGRLGLLERHDSWDVKPLGQMIQLINGAPFDSNLFNRTAAGKPLIRIRDVGKADTETWFSGAYEDKYIVRAGDILVGLDGDFRVAEWQGPEALLNQRVCKLVADASVLDKKFMLYNLQGWLDAIWEETSATTVKHLSSKSIQEIPFPCPPLEEQRRIVKTLDDHLSRLDKALAEVERSQRLNDNLRESLVNGIVCGQYSDNLSDWQATTLGEVARWSSGGTPQSGNPKYYGGSIPWCVIGDLTESSVTETAKTITEEGLAASSAKIVTPGTVLLAMYGASIGRTGIAGKPMATNQAIACAVTNANLDPNYLLLYLQSQKRMFIESGKGGAQPNISQTIIKTWALSLPPFEEQKRLLGLADLQQATIANLNELTVGLEKQYLWLRRSLLHAAFTGDLVA